MEGRFVQVCGRKGLEVNLDTSKGIVLGGEEGFECEVHVDGIHLEHALEFKYLGYVLYRPGTYETECSMKVASGRRVAGAIRSLVNARDLQLEFAMVLHETLLLPVLLNGCETIIWKEKKKSRSRAIQMDSLRGFPGIRRMYKMTKDGDERIDEGVSDDLAL